MSGKRSIFEEVDNAEKPASKPKKSGGIIDQGRDEWRKPARIWMLILFKLVVLMIVVGGLTRLTDSGLSITEWNVISGAVPPMGEAAWLVEFDKYKAIPEYELQNKGMTLGEFKTIYWWEWGHRQLGRLIGLVWAMGFVYLLMRYTIPRAWQGRMLLLGILGGAQGAIGWWMVSSGLTGRMVDVASYRLATHLGLAFIIMSFLLWYMFRLKRSEMELFQAQRNEDRGMSQIGVALYVVTFFQILLGALVAGIDAGRGYIDWPLMGGQFLPSESFDYTPFLSNFFENPALVQFNHRMIGYILFAFIIWVFFRSKRSAHAIVQSTAKAALVMATLQMLLGIMTVLYAAPWYFAIVHQLGAVMLLALVLKLNFDARTPFSRSISAS